MGRSSALDNKEFELDEKEGGRFADKQKDDLLDNKSDAATTLANQKAFEEIYKGARKELMKSGTVLSEEERRVFQEKLMLANQERDPKKLAEIQKHLSETIDQTRELTQQYFKGLDLNKDFFGKDTSRNVDTLKEYKDDFAKQNLKNKKEWSNKLGDEIRSLQELRNDLVRVVGAGKESQAYMDQFNKLRRSEKREYLKELKTNVEAFTKTLDTFKKSGLYSDEEIKNLSVRFRESPLDQQKKMLTDLQEDAKNESIKSVQDTFKKFSPETQKKYEAALKKARGLKAKKELIEEMKQGLRGTFIQQYENASYQDSKGQSRRLNSPQETKTLISSIDKEQRPEVLEMFLNGMPAANAKLTEFAKVYDSAPANVQTQYDFWNADYSKKELMAKDCEKHVKKIGEWNGKLEKAIQDRLIGSVSAGRYQTQFEKLNLKQKDEVLQRSTLDDPRRKDIRDRFDKLPKEIQKKHEHFFDMGLEDRSKLVIKEEKNLERVGKAEKSFEKKIDDMIENHLLSEESKDAYMKWLTDMEDVEDMEKALDKSDLDLPERGFVLETFQKLPDDVRAKYETMFYQQDLTARIETIDMLLPEDARANFRQALSSMEAARQLTDNLEKQTELKTLRNMANEFRDKKNQKAELEIRAKIAKLEPEDEMNQERLEELQMLENPDSQFIGDLLMQIKGQAGMKEEIEANHIMFEIADRAHAHELYSKKQGMENRLAANDNQEFTELSQELYEYSEGEQMLDRQSGKAIDMQVFDENELFRNKNVAKITEHRKRFKKDGETFTHSPARLGQYGLRDHTGKELKGEELLKYKRQKATLLAAKILNMGTEGQITGTPSDEVVEEMLKAMDEIDDFRNVA